MDGDLIRLRPVAPRWKRAQEVKLRPAMAAAARVGGAGRISAAAPAKPQTRETLLAHFVGTEPLRYPQAERRLRSRGMEA